MSKGGQALQVPDCLRKEPDRLYLEEWERRELVKHMLEDGVGPGLEKGIREATRREGGIAKAIKRMRHRIQDQFDRSRRDVDKRYRDDVSSLRKKWTYRSEERDDKRKDLERRHRLMGGGKDLDLDDLLMDDDLVSIVMKGPELTLWQRFVFWLKRGWYKFVWALARFWRWVTGKGREQRPKWKRPRRGLLLRGMGVETKFGKALLSSPALKREIDDRIRVRDDLEGDLTLASDRERYMEAAITAFNDHIRERRHEERKGHRKRRKRLEDRIRKLTQEEEQAEREIEERLEDLAKEREKELAGLEEGMDEGPRKEVEQEVLHHFKRMGYLKESRAGPVFTSRMIDRFAEIIYHSEMEALPSRLQARTGQAESKHGSYERTRMRTVHEISKIDIVESLVRSRISHPRYRQIYDDDIMINREVCSERCHVVLMLDKSSSMEENDRIMAAKKAVLALYKAAKRANPRNIVDLVTFDTRVHVTDLDTLWGSEPSGFTNTGEALRMARQLLGPSRADKKMVYLITDGLPEAFTNEEGRAKAGDRKESLEFALRQASELARVKDQRLIVLLLEPEAEMYVDAATSIAKRAAGSLIVTDPRHLAGEMLIDYAKT